MGDEVAVLNLPLPLVHDTLRRVPPTTNNKICFVHQLYAYESSNDLTLKSQLRVRFDVVNMDDSVVLETITLWSKHGGKHSGDR
jgi:hypothetical protein